MSARALPVERRCASKCIGAVEALMKDQQELEVAGCNAPEHGSWIPSPAAPRRRVIRCHIRATARAGAFMACASAADYSRAQTAGFIKAVSVKFVVHITLGVGLV